jgi:hypothetical protein
MDSETSRLRSDYAEFVGSFRVAVGNGLLIIRDTESTATHEGWQDEDIHVEPDSVYLCVQNPVDGPVSVEIFEGQPAQQAGDTIVLDGTISSLHGTFVIHDPANDVRLVVRTDRGGDSHLRITVDQAWRPSVVQMHFWQ